MKKTILGLFVLSTLLLLNGCNNNKNIIEDITDIQDTENDVEYIKEDCMI
jgi:outer membrane murein-binding lipoprotein Lpp